VPQPAHRALRQRARVEDRDALLRAAEEAFEAGEYASSLELSRRAVAAADEAAASILDEGRAREVTGNVRASARRLLALSALYGDSIDEATQAAQEAVRIATAAGAHKEQALAELAFSEIVRAQGDNVEGLRWAEKAKASAARALDPATTRSVLADFGLLLGRMGDGERSREALAHALALPAEGQPPARAFRVLVDAARTHLAAGRYQEALRACDRAADLAQGADLGATWPLLATRVAVHIELGALDLARDMFDAHPIAPDAPTWKRAQRLTLQATLALAEGERPHVAEHLAAEGLVLPGLDTPSRLALTQLRAQALLARGHADEAERIAVEITSQASKGADRALAAQAMALAARATSRPEAALLRWLGAFALAVNGVAARLEHEAIAVLATEADPIGSLARTGLAVVRARLLDRAPSPLRLTLKRTLRAVEARATTAKQARRLEVETALSPDVVAAKDEVGLVGTSPPLVRAIVTIARAARSDTSLIITGETGSGKELCARLAHRLSPRARGPFVAINCAAIPEPLLEAELFGHERGAFTGAERARAGLFVEAQGGTLFLDEVGEMSRAMQAKLLRVLEEHEVRPVGGNRARKVDVRVLGATHRDLGAMVSSGAFREDLYYRLAAVTARVPSLRERPEDMPVIARAVLARDASTQGKRLDVPALTALSEHTWPGNVRELANVLRVAASLVEGNMISGDEMREAIRSSGARAVVASERSLEETNVASLRARHRSELRELVGRAIAAADGNKLRAARSLGISRQGLYRILAELDAG
jgi:DNA-binding NtrC family response regulator/tetratricopeptide (TPR) repeat protein